MNDNPAKHLIIAGVTRAGTTSLFNYLADHPDVQRASIKETRFFMDTDELKRLHRFEEGLDVYDNYFRGSFRGNFGGVRLEASPDYLYCPAAAQRIAESLPDVYIVLILREPIARLISWRRYAIQNGLLDPGTTLTQYIQQQFDAQASDASPPQHLRALAEGRYTQYLQPWLDAFGPDQRIVCNYRDLIDDPSSLTKRICQHIGIDPAYYDGYDFDIHNASTQVRFPKLHGAYRSLIWRLKPHVHDRPAARSALRSVRRMTDALLGRSGKARNQHDPGGDLSDTDRARLEAYYHDQPEQLRTQLGLTNWDW